MNHRLIRMHSILCLKICSQHSFIYENVHKVLILEQNVIFAWSILLVYSSSFRFDLKDSDITKLIVYYLNRIMTLY